MSHGITWDRVRRAPAADLKVGDTWVTPGVGTGYHVLQDGTVRGVGWQDLDGILWAVTARTGEMITVRSHDGREATELIRQGAQILRVDH